MQSLTQICSGPNFVIYFSGFFLTLLVGLFVWHLYGSFVTLPPHQVNVSPEVDMFIVWNKRITYLLLIADIIWAVMTYNNENRMEIHKHTSKKYAYSCEIYFGFVYLFFITAKVLLFILFAVYTYIYLCTYAHVCLHKNMDANDITRVHCSKKKKTKKTTQSILSFLFQSVYSDSTFNQNSKVHFGIVYFCIVAWIGFRTVARSYAVLYHAYIGVLHSPHLFGVVHASDSLCHTKCKKVSCKRGHGIIHICTYIQFFFFFSCHLLFIILLIAVYLFCSVELLSSERKLSHLLVKYSALVMSTIVAMMVMVGLFLSLNQFAFVLFEFWFNGLCVVLMAKVHERTYRFCCCACHRCVQKILNDKHSFGDYIDAN
ncbi:hypothetical protein RFI_02773 [Reticulomyxa filosa]|uniref:Uncharacterized protein n=1 Tax=Reticulomyxa filosa TaxID=46433 RepID=X6P6Z6_RETFI|nr:hypothetical protein RFI_02773 [Reticulomyxa filosa]|eukprot:ETO34320.1 hypothetical protein RFI_02773 [Reticulomyxa filosa]